METVHDGWSGRVNVFADTLQYLLRGESGLPIGPGSGDVVNTSKEDSSKVALALFEVGKGLKDD